MPWGTVELEPEVDQWVLALNARDFGHVMWSVELLTDRGPTLDEPYTRQLDGKLRELRFRMAGRDHRITYWIASGRRIVLLTHFCKSRMRERAEVARAKRAYATCVAEHHDTEEG